MIEALKKEHIDQVVEVHIQAFPESQSTKFGKDFLKSYYGGAASSPHTTSFVWNVDGKVAGFIFGGTNKQELSRQIMMSSKTKLAKAVITNVLRDPLNSIKRFWSYLVHYIMPGGDTFYANDTATLDSVAILKEFRGQGIADELIQAFLEQLKEFGVSACRLGVLGENTSARSFYERNSFEQFNEEGTIYLYFFDDKYRESYKTQIVNLNNEE
ncbi:MAG: ribosomal protein S18 acetylase RimI-like enzyme [Algoriphagus sp.]|jgi:ribosomal protein S18 acetylase RimI-like enzyme